MEKAIYNEAEMVSFAKHVWQKFIDNRDSAVIFALEGELGAGKTTFTKALAQTMGITDTITSPTFILHDEYPELDHIDAWRMEDPQELVNLGLQKMIEAKRVIVIEWADKVEQEIKNINPKAKVIWIKFEHTDQENERRVSYEDLGDRNEL
jgi:tRNA threonylcarbamoyladenosine biosynthesis protein TsaE